MPVEAPPVATGSIEVPSLPVLFARINEAVNSPNTSMADIAAILSEDPGLCARLLSIANSSFFNFSSPVDSIPRAITVVGTQQIRDLALATTVTSVFKQIPENLITMESFWRHSVACGVIARILATYHQEANVERFFVAGMLHDIGRLLLYIKKPANARTALHRCRATGELLHKVEGEEFGYTHSAVGAALMRAWKLPPHLDEVVAFHHTPGQAKKFPIDVSIVHVADIVAHTMELGSSGEKFVPPMDPLAWDQLTLSTSVLSPALKQAERQYRDAVQMIFESD